MAPRSTWPCQWRRRSSFSWNAQQALTYTIMVINSGPNSAANVGVQDLLPTTFIVQAASTTQGTVLAPPPGGTGTLTASLGTLASGGSATVRVTGSFRARKTS